MEQQICTSTSVSASPYQHLGISTSVPAPRYQHLSTSASVSAPQYQHLGISTSVPAPRYQQVGTSTFRLSSGRAGVVALVLLCWSCCARTAVVWSCWCCRAGLVVLVLLCSCGGLRLVALVWLCSSCCARPVVLVLLCSCGACAVILPSCVWSIMSGNATHKKCSPVWGLRGLRGHFSSMNGDLWGAPFWEVGVVCFHTSCM